MRSDHSPASKATFGAPKLLNKDKDKDKVDYYTIAHRIQEGELAC